VDAASDVDGRQVGRQQLGDQTRPDADHSPTSRAFVGPFVRPRPVPLSGKVRNTSTSAKAHFQHFNGGASLSTNCLSPV